VVLLSGGLDSTVAAAIAVHDGFEVHALTIDYGQRHAVELDAARRVARELGLASHRIVRVDLRAIGGSALTAEIEVPRGVESRKSKVESRQPIPVTYVPARNTVLLGLALGHAEVLGAQDVYIGVSSVDYSGYPDCRPAFIAAFERLAQVATKAGVEGRPIRIHAPLQHWTKAATIRRGLELGVDFALTHTCYDPAPSGEACGVCDSCRLRREAFAEAGVPDPTQYAARPSGPSPKDGVAVRNEERKTRNEKRSVRVLEMLRTIQGETSHAGEPCILVRLAGCPLRCSYCDTTYAREAEGMELTVEEIVRAVRDLGPGIVAVTGGEPLDQPGTFALLRALADDGRTVLLETSGAFDVSAVDPRVHRIIDVKSPGSGMAGRNLPGNLDAVRPIDELKFVLVDRGDYEWARDLVRRERLHERCTVLFSAAYGKLPAPDLAKWILDDALPVRLQVQLHRILWPDRDRGV
jgi:7-cyano-7-deazaguanine synthase